MAVQTIEPGQQSRGPAFSSVCRASGQNLLMPFGNLRNPGLDWISGKPMDTLGIKTRKSQDNRLKCLRASHLKLNPADNDAGADRGR